MNECGYKYVVDNNTLSHLSRAQRASEFFRKNAVIPAEVLYEAQGFPDAEKLQDSEYPTTPTVLMWLEKVMATISPADTRLVDLYANQGNADPLLIACALDGQDLDNQLLMSPTWVVVTGDRAVRAKAKEFDLPVLTNEQFAKAVDEA